MGICRSNESRWRLFSRRGTAVALIVGAHAVLALALSQNRLGQRFDEAAPPPVQVTLFTEVKAEPAPAQIQPKLAQLRPAEVRLPEVEMPLVASAPVAVSITVTKPPPVEQAVAASPAAETGPLVVDRVEYLSKVPVTYPVMARRARAQGTVLLRVLIGPDGCPIEVRVDHSSGHSLLDQAAREAVLRYRFKPYRENGVARTVQAVVPIDFSLAVRTASRG